MNHKLLLGVVFITLVCISNVFGQQYQRYKQLDESWYYFDQNQRHQSYSNSKKQKIFLTLDKNLPESSILQMFVGANTSIFVDEQIIDFTEHNKIVSYSIDSLFSAHFIVNNQLTIMLYHQSAVWAEDGEILKPMISSDTTVFTPITRMDVSYENVLIILILIILVIFSYIKVVHGDIWRGYMKWSRIISLKDQGDAIYKLRPFEKGTLIIVLAYATLGATIIMELLYLSGAPSPALKYFQSGHTPLLILKWSGLVLLLFVMAFGKYFLVKSFTELFDFKGALRMHFYNHIRISMVLLVMLLIVNLILIFGFHSILLSNWLMNLIIILLFFKSILIALKLFKNSTYRIFHLFSYLCATEIIPAIILIKVIFLI